MIALTVAGVCVLALVAGAFALSYPGARATAINAGVSPDLARVYPGIFGAVLLVACAAALSLRRAWRFFAWLVVLVVIGAVAAADTVHALSIALPKRPMEITAAAAPWAALVIGLLLLDAMARQSRPRRNAAPPGYAAGPGLNPAAQRPGSGGQLAQGTATVPLSALLAVSRPAAPAAAPPAPHPAGPPITQPGVRPAPHPIQPTARFATQPAAQATAQAAQHAQQPASPQARQPAAKQAAEPTAQALGDPGTEAATHLQPEKAAQPAEAGPANPQQPEAEKPADSAKPQQPEAAKPAGPEPGKPKQVDTSKPAEAEPTQPQSPVAGEPTKAEPGKPQQAEGSTPAKTGTEKPQAEAAKTAEGEPAKLPEPAPPQPGDRDEPSDADAEPAEPSTLFSWLRRSRTAPGGTPGNGTPASSKKPAAPSSKAGTDS